MAITTIRLGQIQEERERFPEKFKANSLDYWDEVKDCIQVEVPVIIEPPKKEAPKEEVKPKKMIFSSKRK